MPSIEPSKSTTLTRIAKVPYLNSAPFYYGLEQSGLWELIDSPPSEQGIKAANGEVAAGLLPVVDYFRLQDQFERIGHFGIAVSGRAHSTTLFSLKPIHQLDGAKISLTTESSTTVCLLRLLLEQRYHLHPSGYLRGNDSKSDALLLIGDEAMRFSRTNKAYPFEADMAFEWWLWQHLPFVFAVWVVRKDADPQLKKELERDLARSLGMSMGHLDKLAEASSESLGIPADELKVYLSSFTYRLGPVEENAIGEFKRLLDEHALLGSD